jgi:TPR repeat protein
VGLSTHRPTAGCHGGASRCQGSEERDAKAAMAPTERARQLREGARRGSAQDQISLALCYYDGKEGLTENKWMAEALFRKAAAQGHAGAQVGLGHMCENGEVVEQNLELAVSWYREAAKQGHPRGHFNLGVMHEYGKGVEQNLELAVWWYCESAKQGDLEGQCCLGRCLLHGNGVEKDADAAVTWFRQAAAAGHANAYSDIALCYALGKGVEQNDALAVEWWAKAVKGGNVVSRYNLGVGYMDGVYGLPKDVKRAKAFMKSAATRGCAEAIESLKVLGGCAMELDPGPCVSCGAPDITRTCLGCRQVRYCTLACQDRDWASHKPDCGGLKAC